MGVQATVVRSHATALSRTTPGQYPLHLLSYSPLLTFVPLLMFVGRAWYLGSKCVNPMYTLSTMENTIALMNRVHPLPAFAVQ